MRHKLRLIEENFPKPREKRIFGGEKNGGGVNTHLLCDIPRRDETRGRVEEEGTQEPGVALT